MDKDIEALPIIDKENALKKAGNDPLLAKDLLNMLIANLPADLTTIKQAYADKNNSDLYQRVHKLHGGISYCGLPRLKAILQKIEFDLKLQKTDELPGLLEALETQARLLIELVDRQ